MTRRTFNTMSKWVGYAVSVNCGETLGCYQGTILDADGLTITLTKAFRNGFPYPKSKVTLNAVDIKDLRIIESRSERAETHSTVVAPAPATSRKSRATVCETLQANPTSTGNQTLSSSNSKSANSRNTNQAPLTRTKPVEIVAPRNKNHNNQQGASTGLPGMGGVTSMSGGVLEKARRRNEACFGDAAEPALDDDFDFEGNLALFDKRAVWASMRNSKARNAHQAPCVVCVVGAHRGGASALAAARLLASRGVRPHLHVTGTAPHCAALQRELAALQLDRLPIHASLADLPTAPDLVLVALYDPLLDNDQDQYRAVCQWAGRCRAACVVLEPAGGGWAGVECRACVMGVACVALPAALGRLYLADVGAPQRLYADRMLRYRPPYGAAAVLPLHPHH